MNFNRLNTKLFTALICWCILTITSAAAQQAVPPLNAPYAGAKVYDFQGKVVVQLPAQAVSGPARGEILPPGTMISTDAGRVLLRIQDGSDVLIRPHTRVVLNQPAVNDFRYIQLLLGRIRAEIQKRIGGTPSFQIGTPSAVISVRGTRFEVEVDRHSITEVDVDEGIVQLESVIGSGTPVLVNAGFSSRVGLGSGPEAPRPTEEMRPEIERERDQDKNMDRDDPLEELRAEGQDRQERNEEQSMLETEQQGSQADPSDPR
ncbi:MAG TPA: FecR family protein [Terriglobales bacterium]|nr:FecR family protein [Terriglobales bacterium]